MSKWISDLRSNKFDSLACVKDRRGKPAQFEPPEAAQTGTAQPQQIQPTAPVSHSHQRVSDTGEVGLPVFFHVTASRQVEPVVTPTFGHAVHGCEETPLIRPLHATLWFTVVLHPLRGEVSQPRGILTLGIPRRIHFGSLHSHIKSLHFPYSLHPWPGVLCIQHQDETRGEANVAFLPPIENLPQAQAFPT